MAMNRLDAKTKTHTRKFTIISALVFVGAALICFLFVEINLAIAVEPNITWPPLSEQDKSALRSRWNAEKIKQVRAALKTPDKPLPVEKVPYEVLVKDLSILAKAHGVYGIEGEPLNWYFKYEPSLRYSDLRGIPLQGCTLKNVNLRYTYLEGANLSNCDLTSADLTGANLREANLTGAILNEAKLDLALLIQADLSGAKLNYVSFKQALLYGCRIVDADLIGADFERAQFVDFQEIMGLKFLKGLVGSDVEQGPQSYRPANLSNSNFFKTNLSGAILGDANLDGASLYEVMFVNTLIDVKQFERALNYRYIRAGASPSRINFPAMYLQYVEVFHREAKRFFAANGMNDMAAEYNFWEQEAKTYKLETPLYSKVLRIAFMKWPYGYGSKPKWLFYYFLSVVFIFATLYVLLTINKKKSGIYRVYRENEQEEKILLTWRNGLMFVDCLYFSLLSLVTFGYGVFKPRQWIELFRFEPVQLRPVGWVRILVGLEAAIGIYLLALLTTVLFGKV